MNDTLFWDIDTLDGEPFPIQNVIIIEIPKKILKTMSRKEVKEKATKYVAKGVMPIIFYY